MITIQTVTTDIRDALGALASGTVSIRPNAAWSYDDGTGGQDKIVPTPKSVTVTAGKVTAFALPPSKNGGVITVNAGYIVTYTLANTPEWTELWILDAAGGSTIEWGAIQIADSSLTQPPSLPIAGPAGPQGATGQSVDHVSLTSGNSAPGTTDTYTIWADVAETVSMGTFAVYNGNTGPQGAQGVQGSQGIQGIQGLQGQSVDHVSLTSGNSAPGTTDTYTVWGDAGATINLGTFLVYNGLNGGGTGDMVAATYDAAGIAEQLCGLTSAQTLTNKTLTAPVINSPTGITPADVGALDAATREAANGVAGLDANLELIRSPSGAAAEVLAGRGSGYKRADGTWGYGGHKGVAYYNGANFTLANSLWTKVPVNAVNMAVQNPQIPIVNGSLVIQKSGHYVMQAKVLIGYTTLGTIYIGIGKNGAATYSVNFQTNPQNSIFAFTSAPAFLAAGTTIELFAWSNTGSVITATADNYIAAFEV